jgi:serine/threonine protein kinase
MEFQAEWPAAAPHPQTAGTDPSTSGVSADQWPRVREIFHEAVDRPEGARAAFVREACHGDTTLHAAIESLLASDQSARDFMRRPAVARVGLPAVVSAALTAGQRVGAYEILAPIGVGGMGEVYRARDPRLGRDIALKVLPADVTHDDTRRQWFEREARAAAVLDHPNICPVYDIGDQDGRIWIAMQYVEGETLADRLRRGPLLVPVALDVAAQIASALNAAHARGIVHRDVKPENVMITPSGQAKVLDFGLAKVTADPGKGRDDSAAIDEPHPRQTGVDGMRLGTLPYMSPEQVRGDQLDVRTDVFSLSAVLYEMVTGRRPFEGNADADVATAILSVTPPSVTDLVPTVPAVVAQIMRTGLEKDRSRRYQTMRDLAIDLEAATHSLHVSVSRRIVLRPWITASVLAIGTIGLAGLLASSGRTQATNSKVTLQYTQLTNFPDYVHSPTVSPDGKALAFVRRLQSGAGSELYVKTLPTGQPHALTHDGTAKDAPTFSSDGSRIVFTDPRTWSSFSVPLAGGPPTLFMRNASGLRWSGPEHVLFSEMKKAPNMGIVGAGQSGAGARDIYVPVSATGMAHASVRSPDGQWVLVVEMDNAWLPCRLVPFDGTSPGRSVGPRPAECKSAAWSPDGRWMYFAAAVDGESHLWRQSFPDGSPEQITFGPNQEWGVAVDPDGRSVITAVGATQSTVWYHDERGDRPVSVEGYAYRPLVSPDGSRVFYLVRRAPTRSFSIGELWATDLATGRNERLLSDFLIRSYHVANDGRLVTFDTFDSSGRSSVWLAAVDGSVVSRRLTPDGAEEQRPFFGASGDIYLMQEQSHGLPSLYRMKRDGSGRQKLAGPIDFLVNVSPDEDWAVLWSFQGTRLVPLAGGVSRGVCSSCGMGPIVLGSPGVSWSSDSKTMFVDAGNSNAPTGTVLIPWQGANTLPATGAPSSTDLLGLPGARHVPESSIAPGPTSATYAFVRQSEQSNLYRIPLP